MKRINTLLLALLSVVTLTLTSCNDSIEYTPVGPVEGAGVYFPTSTRTSYELEGTSGSITLDVMRTDSVGAIDATLTTTFTEGGESVFSVPGTVSFADGASTSSLTINYDNLVQGTTYNITMTFAEGTPYSNSTLTLTLIYPEEIVYEWEVVSENAILAEGLFSMFGVGPYELTGITVEKAKGYDIYRFQSPYTNEYMAEYWGLTGNLFPEDYEYPYIVLDGETYKSLNRWYISATALGFKWTNGAGPSLDATYNTFGSVAVNLQTSEGQIPANSTTYPLGTFNENKQQFDFGAVYHNIDAYGLYLLNAGSFTLALDPALLEPDYDRDYTWHAVPEATGMFTSTLAGGVWHQTVEQSEEDPTFYRMPNLYSETEKAHIYFNVDLETGTVTIPRGQDTGLTTFGNIVRLEGTPNRSSYNVETGELTLAFTLYLSNEDGDDLADLTQISETFLWGQTLSAPIDDYVGQWVVPFDNGQEDGQVQIPVNVTKVDANTLAVQGLSGMDGYNDAIALDYDSENGIVQFSMQQVGSIADQEGNVYYGFVFPFNSVDGLLGEASLVGGITKNGTLRFVSPVYDSMVYTVSPNGQQFSLLSGYWNYLEWEPYNAAAATKSIATFSNFKVKDSFKALNKMKESKNIQNNELNIEALPKVQKGAKGAASLKVRVNSGIQAGNFSLVR